MHTRISHRRPIALAIPVTRISWTEDGSCPEVPVKLGTTLDVLHQPSTVFEITPAVVAVVVGVDLGLPGPSPPPAEEGAGLGRWQGGHR